MLITDATTEIFPNVIPAGEVVMEVKLDVQVISTTLVFIDFISKHYSYQKFGITAILDCVSRTNAAAQMSVIPHH